MASNRLAEFEDFAATDDYVVREALRRHAEYFEKNSQEIRTQYDAIKDDPAKCAAQDRSLITTRGLFHAAGAMAEAGQRAREALTEWESLMGGEDPEGHNRMTKRMTPDARKPAGSRCWRTTAMTRPARLDR